jgi:hypothetical protein
MVFSHDCACVTVIYIRCEIPVVDSCISCHMTFFWCPNAKKFVSQYENFVNTNYFLHIPIPPEKQGV